MMYPEPWFIPLFFNEAEEDLWQALQRIEQNKRSFFIKETLRQALLGKNRVGEILADPVPLKPVKLNESPNDRINNLEEEAASFSLEALFSKGSELEDEFEGFKGTENAHPDPPGKPWDTLLNDVIGEEDDAHVINAILQAFDSSPPQDDQSSPNSLQAEKPEFQIAEINETNKLNGQLYTLGDQAAEIDLASLQVDLPLPVKGFEYLMKHVIGTEEDEAVLEALQARSKA